MLWTHMTVSQELLFFFVDLQSWVGCTVSTRKLKQLFVLNDCESVRQCLIRIVSPPVGLWWARLWLSKSWQIGAVGSSNVGGLHTHAGWSAVIGRCDVSYCCSSYTLFSTNRGILTFWFSIWLKAVSHCSRLPYVTTTDNGTLLVEISRTVYCSA